MFKCEITFQRQVLSSNFNPPLLICINLIVIVQEVRLVVPKASMPTFEMSVAGFIRRINFPVEPAKYRFACLTHHLVAAFNLLNWHLASGTCLASVWVEAGPLLYVLLLVLGAAQHRARHAIVSLAVARATDPDTALRTLEHHGSFLGGHAVHHGAVGGRAEPHSVPLNHRERGESGGSERGEAEGSAVNQALEVSPDQRPLTTLLAAQHGEAVVGNSDFDLALDAVAAVGMCTVLQPVEIAFLDRAKASYALWAACFWFGKPHLLTHFFC